MIRLGLRALVLVTAAAVAGTIAGCEAGPPDIVDARSQVELNGHLDELQSGWALERVWGAWQIGLMGPGGQRAVPYLADALARDPDAYVRTYAAEALGRIGAAAAPALPALEAALDDPDDGVVQAAALARRQIRAAMGLRAAPAPPVQTAPPVSPPPTTTTPPPQPPMQAPATVPPDSPPAAPPSTTPPPQPPQDDSLTPA
ncbi:MAG: hypothetical protein BIFFINMI_03988 [Phycisphaerae bacterium]|nr:hypothetical protein [Phycisphaerae bacterium]